MMPDAGRNSLKKSRIDQDRQQRHEQPKVSGAAGSPDDSSPAAAEEAARRRRGKTRKHVSEDD
jgi:hypothetical protein